MSQSSLPRLTFQFAKKHGIMVKELTETHCVLIHKEQVDPIVFSELRRFIQKPLQLEPVDDITFEKALIAHYQQQGGAEQAISDIEKDIDLSALAEGLPQTQDLLESEGDAPIIRLINATLNQAINNGASDVHFETFEETLTIRFRIDGVLHEILTPPRALAPLITSRLKIMAKLDIAEKRLPQDGRISLRLAGRNVDVRVSTIPTHFGERIVLRLLDKQAVQLDLTHLGMADQTLDCLTKLIAKPHGIILMTGPTGSGKTTTLYAILTSLNDGTRNILTVEDPIEYYLPGIGQTQVNAKADMTFARGLRAILRQDPDVVMAGEIRDHETVTMAVQASLTGHLVLSTLHTNTAIGAITRLRDLKAESFLISTTVIGVAAQRLVRLLCPNCKIAKPATPAEKKLLGLDKDQEITLYEPGGCEACNHTGYKGRKGIYEVISIDSKMREMIHDDCSEGQLNSYARTQFPSIRADGYRLVLTGATTLAEVSRVTAEDAI